MTTETLLIKKKQTEKSRLHEVDFNNLGFGRIMSDHMFIADYRDGQWQNLRIVPYGDLSLSPATAALHYGQAIFEGMKAYKNNEGDTLLFRATDNWKRLNKSAERLCMPAVPEEVFMNGLTELVRLDSAWVPSQDGSALYIRPFMFSTDPYVGVKPSDTYTFIIFTGPVGAYFAKPPRVKIETQFIRSAEGGVGGAKCAGNYAGSLYPAKLAQEEGYDQLIWTDAHEHAYIEESGAMNVMFVLDDGTLLTPAVSDTTLDGITRKTILAIARHWGIPVEERRISVQEIISALKEGRLESAFGAGTAAVVSHISTIGYERLDYTLPDVKEDSFAKKVKEYLIEIYTGKTEDLFGWTLKV
ncbi:branched-chain amino acid aminotransferase [Dyadobacter diqingensis]|uniref:branched-chain amino acid aminotransferase n=1 Tax=Dyadobacter diqingensis TaxID=2938121 RepID=UPI0020C1A72A|nr:branched-chain amino acid aminotransferase [Dyadobacter diqingensis]